MISLVLFTVIVIIVASVLCYCVRIAPVSPPFAGLKIWLIIAIIIIALLVWVGRVDPGVYGALH